MFCIGLGSLDLESPIITLFPVVLIAYMMGLLGRNVSRLARCPFGEAAERMLRAPAARPQTARLAGLVGSATRSVTRPERRESRARLEVPGAFRDQRILQKRPSRATLHRGHK
jgi:hypothetical protein